MARKFLPTSVLCDRYERSSRTIDRWVAAGVLPKPMRIRGVRYWDEEQIEARDKERLTEAAA
jgi:hypothetical protein